MGGNKVNDCDELLDAARAALLSVTFDKKHATDLVSKLRACADTASDIGDAAAEQNLRQAVAKLRQRLPAGS